MNAFEHISQMDTREYLTHEIKRKKKNQIASMHGSITSMEQT
jgi:hypothetical protein